MTVTDTLSLVLALEPRALLLAWASFLITTLNWALLLSLSFWGPRCLWVVPTPVPLPTLTSEQVRVQQLLLDDVIGHHLSTVDNGISCDVGPSPC